MAIIITDTNNRGARTDVDATISPAGPPFAVYCEFKTTGSGKLLWKGNHNTSGETVEYQLTILSDGRIRGEWAYASGSYLIATSVASGLNDGAWHRALYRLEPDGAGGTQAYMSFDGVSTVAGSVADDTTEPAGDDRLYIGGREAGGFQVPENSTVIRTNIDAELRHVALFTRDFTSPEADDLTTGVTTPADYLVNLVGWWRLDYGVYPAVAGGIDGTPLNHPSFTEPPPELMGSLPGLTASADATQGTEVDATLGASLPALEATFYGYDITAELGASLPAVEAEFVTWPIVDPILASLDATLPALAPLIEVERELPPVDDIEVGFTRVIGFRSFPVRWPPPV